MALLLIWIARRDAAAVRAQAASDAAETKKDLAAQAADIDRRMERVLKREEQLEEQRRAELERHEKRVADLTEREHRVAAAARDVDDELTRQLAYVAGITVEQARTELLAQLQEDAQRAALATVRRIERNARAEAVERANRILVTAVQRLAVPTSAQAIVTLVTLPSEEMKGRIIGKEGRNIRTFEAITGVNVIIDDTPTSVLLSSFDPQRREVARDMLEALVADGRIHPQRIEEAYDEALVRLELRADEAGAEAAEEVGISGLRPEILRLMGQLRLRTSFGQNVLAHCVESAHLAAMIAGELGLDVELARRAAFLHDIGKALTHEVEGTHALVGAEFARRHGESAAVVNAIAAHHEEVPAETLEAVVVQIADACSAARPGARRDELEQYVERVENLERLAMQHEGVTRAFAMNAGREVRIAVEPAVIDDAGALALAEDLAGKIEAELSYPGYVKVVVIREVRATATAR